MLPKRQRLTTTAFMQAFQTGRRYHDLAFQLIVAPSDTFHGAAVVGKKVYKRAVDRNRLRRQLYGLLYRSGVTTQGTYIIVAKPAATQLSRTERAAHVQQLLKQGQVCRPISTDGQQHGTIRPHC